jgi:N-acetylmuramoyl-L-alanine amidase
MSVPGIIPSPRAPLLAALALGLVVAGSAWAQEQGPQPPVPPRDTALQKGAGGVVARASVFEEGGGSKPPAVSPWKLLVRSGRDYVNADDISKFYGLPHVEAASDKLLRMESGAKSLQFERGSRHLIVNDVSHWLSFPALVEDDNWLISRLDLVKTLEPAMRPEYIANLEPVEVVVLDPGHGGHDKGATSRYGTEKEFALDVALKVRDILREKGVVVIMTRDDDTFVTLEDRAAIANKANHAMLVSIHFNDSDFGSEANGFEVFCLAPPGGPGTMDDSVQPSHLQTYPGNAVDACSLALANGVHHSILAHMGRLDRGVKRQRFAVLKLTKWPSVLVECGFLNGREESKVVATEKWRQRLAYALSEGILEYRHMALTRKPPKSLADYLGRNRNTERAEATPMEPRVLIPR